MGHLQAKNGQIALVINCNSLFVLGRAVVGDIVFSRVLCKPPLVTMAIYRHRRFGWGSLHSFLGMRRKEGEATRDTQSEASREWPSVNLSADRTLPLFFCGSANRFDGWIVQAI